MKRLMLIAAFMPFASMGGELAPRSLGPIDDPVSGYIWQDTSLAPDTCAYQWQEPSAQAQPLTPANMDDGAAQVTLAAPIVVHGITRPSLMASVNGYLAFPSGEEWQEDGADIRSVCALPAIPSNEEAWGSRLFALHDDWVLTGELLLDHQEECQRPSGAGPSSCSILTWSAVEAYGAPDTQASFQALLYHATGTLVVQVRQAPALPAVIGLQDASLGTGRALACGEQAPLSSAASYCAFTTAHPPGTTPSVELFSDGFETPAPL